MVEILVRIHDKFSVEMKIGFAVKRKTIINDFAVNTWLFVPNSLDINDQTYSKSQFYRDVKSNVRLITPIFLLREIVDGQAIPLRNIKQAFMNLASPSELTDKAEYEYQIKMFMAIFKSSLRDQRDHIMNTPLDTDIAYLCNEYLSQTAKIKKAYRELRHIINVPTVEPDALNYYMFGDEFMSSIILRHTFRLIKNVERRPGKRYEEITGRLVQLAAEETAYARAAGYPIVDPDSPTNNRNVIFRNSVLKKYIESDLFLQAKQKVDGVVVRQIYYSLAAGIAMIFATAIAFWGQLRYGNITTPFFFALVVSYMFKDRIKETMRYYFAHRLKDKYFDNKTTISIKDKPIGWIKEGVDFITDDKVPTEIMELRSRSPLLQAENRINDEKIILYRKMVRIDGNALKSEDKYSLIGINDILRLHLTSFLQKMDNPEVPLYTMDENEKIGVILGDKIYYLNILMQIQSDGQKEYKRFRLIFNRSGILEIEELS